MKFVKKSSSVDKAGLIVLDNKNHDKLFQYDDFNHSRHYESKTTKMSYEHFLFANCHISFFYFKKALFSFNFASTITKVCSMNSKKL